MKVILAGVVMMGRWPPADWQSYGKRKRKFAGHSVLPMFVER
jgi:hypothetical protein